MKKKILSILIAIVVIFAVSACGRGSESEILPVLSQTTMDLNLGERGSLSVLNYAGDVKWESSDISIAAISKTGEITPVSIGSAAMTAELENGDTMTCVVQVSPGESKVESIMVTSYYTESSDITVDYRDGNSIALKAECSPLDPLESLKWSSSDELLAGVDQNGVVTFYGNGVVEIKAAALNGVEGKCIVRIKNVPANVQPEVTVDQTEVPVIETDGAEGRFTSPVPVTSPTAKSSIIVSDRNVYLEVAESFTLTYAVGNSTNKDVEWVSSDKAVAIVKNGRIVAVGQGRAVISAVTHDGAVASCSVAVGKEEIALMKKEVAESKR